MSAGRAVVGGLDFYGYNRRIRDGFRGEGWDCDTINIWFPIYDRRFLSHLLFGVLPRKLSIRWPLEAAWRHARRRFVDAVLRSEFDLLLLIRPDLLTAADLETIQRARPRAVIACWLMDSLAYHPRFLESLDGIDRVFTFDAADLPSLREVHPQVRYLPLAFDPADYRPSPTPPKPRWRVSFIGAPHADRLALLEHLCSELNLGPGDVRFVIGAWKVLPVIGRRVLNRRSWLFRDGFLDMESTDHTACQDIYHGSEVCLNIHQPFNPRILRGFNMRVFEVCGAGGFQVVEHLDRLNDAFPEGEALWTYNDADSMVRVVREALADPEERRRTAARGAEHAHAHHTFRHRVKAITEFCSGGRQ
ncbi:MAG: glycosyltransferase [Pseudomonadota bacterium]